MNNSTSSPSRLARAIAIITLFGIIASTSPSAWAQRGPARNVRSKPAAAGRKLSSSASRSKGSAAVRRGNGNGNASQRKSVNSLLGQGGNPFATSNRSGYMKLPNIDGESSQRKQSTTPQGPLFPGGWEFKGNTSGLRRISSGLVSANSTGLGGGIWNDPAVQEGGGLWNDARGTIRQSSFFGQDQETGEIIDFRANFKGARSAGQPHSVVDSEGWDEVPEHLMFGFRARHQDLGQSGFRRAGRHQVKSPRDAASGMATGKR